MKWIFHLEASSWAFWKWRRSHLVVAFIIFSVGLVEDDDDDENNTLPPNNRRVSVCVCACVCLQTSPERHVWRRNAAAGRVLCPVVWLENVYNFFFLLMLRYGKQAEWNNVAWMCFLSVCAVSATMGVKWIIKHKSTFKTYHNKDHNGS